MIMKGARKTMQKELTYKTEGDYLIPDLKAEETGMNWGKYGRMRLAYLKERRRGTYDSLILTGKLAEHLMEIDQTARERVELITAQMAQAGGVDEQLKATDQMKWVGLMNNIKQAAEETVLAELVYN